MTAQRWPEDVGSVADEAGRLLESLRRAGADAAASATSAASAGHQAPGRHARREDPHVEDTPSGFTCDDPVCQWCPVCRASAFVRRLSPETLDGLAELAGFAATVLTDLARARARQEHPEDHAGEPAEDRADG